MRRFRSIIVALLATGSVCLSAGVAWTQDAPPPPEEPAVKEEAPSSLSLELPAAHARLREIAAGLKADAAIDTISAKELPGFLSDVEQLLADPATSEPETMTLRTLENGGQRWQRYSKTIDDWLVTVRGRSKGLESSRDELRSMRESWTARLAKKGEEEVPEAFVEQIESLVVAISEVEEEWRARADFVYGLEGRLAEQDTAIDALLERFAAASRAYRGGLLEPDSPPLWRALGDWQSVELLEAEAKASWDEDTAAIASFVDQDRNRIAWHVALFLALAALAATLKRRAGEWVKEDETLEASARILRRPIAAALLVSILFTRWFYPDAPLVVYELLVLVSIIPVLRLLPGVIFRNLRAPLYGLIALYLLDQIDDLFTPQSLLVRLTEVVTVVLAFAGLSWLVRPGGSLVDRSDSRWWRAAILVARLALVSLGVSLVMNVYGNVSLARLLSAGTLTSVYLAVALYAIVLAVRGLFTLLLRTETARGLHVVRQHAALLNRRFTTWIRAGAVVYWLYIVLNRFRVREPLVERLSEVLTREWQLGALEISIWNVLAFVFSIWIALLVSRFIRFVFQEEISPRAALPRATAGTVSMLLHYVVLAVGFLIAVAAAGIELSQFAIVAGALGVGIGFGLQSIVNNFVSGLVLIFERPIKVGDTVQIGELMGEVSRIGVRASVVRTFSGAEVIVPNGDLIAQQVINWTLSDRLRRIELPVGVAYGSDPNQVIEILVATAKEQEDVLGFPEPYVLFKGFGESSLDFELRCWTAKFDFWLRVASGLTVAIHDRLKEAGIEIPFPQRDLHLRSVEPDAGKALGRVATTEEETR